MRTKINSVQVCRDAAVNREVRGKGGHQVRLDEGVTKSSVAKATCDFQKICDCPAPSDKVNAMARAFEWLKHLASDQLLSTVVYVLVKSWVPNWQVQLAYMKHFRLRGSWVTASYPGYLLLFLPKKDLVERKVLV